MRDTKSLMKIFLSELDNSERFNDWEKLSDYGIIWQKKAEEENLNWIQSKNSEVEEWASNIRRI